MTTPQKRKKRTVTIQTIDSLMERSSIEGDCIEWLGYSYMNKFPQVSHGGAMISVRKLVMILNKRQIPDLGYFKTTCGNELCVRLEHIKMVNQQGHMESIARKVNHQNPVRISKLQKVAESRRKLSDEQVQDILMSDQPSTRLAAIYGVSKSTITNVKGNRARRVVSASVNPFVGLMR